MQQSATPYQMSNYVAGSPGQFAQQQSYMQQQYAPSMSGGGGQIVRSNTPQGMVMRQGQMVSQMPMGSQLGGTVNQRSATSYATSVYSPAGGTPLKNGAPLLQFFSPVYPTEKVPTYEYPVEVRISGPALMGQWKSSLFDLQA